MRMLHKLVLAMAPGLLIQGAASAAPAKGVDADAMALLSLDQGQALVEFALQQGRAFKYKPDCSHLVHTIYQRAGLNYTYAQSRDLYYGIEGFERVSRPQPGDLIVWVGHVGIVVSPNERTFFSSVRSGIITEAWDTDSWKMRGRPRFFRYRIGPATDQALLAALTTPRLEIDDSAGMTQGWDREPSTPARNAWRLPADSASARPPAQSPVLQIEPDSPLQVAVIRHRAKPTKQDVAIALEQSGKARAQKLIAGQVLDLSRPISIIERVEIQKIRIKHESGSITLKLTETLSLAGGKVIPGKKVDRRFDFYRRNDVWVISDPQERFYLPQDQAISVFEQQAAIFLQRTPDSNDTRAIIKALDVLFDLNPAGAERAAIR